MSEADTPQGPFQQPQQIQQQRLQFQPQGLQQNPIRPNVVSNVEQGARPPPPPSQISGQPATAVPQQRPAALRRADSRGNILLNQFANQQLQQQLPQQQQQQQPQPQQQQQQQQQQHQQQPQPQQQQQRPLAPPVGSQPVRPQIPLSGPQSFQQAQPQQQAFRQQSPGTLSPQQSSNQLLNRQNFSYPNQPQAQQQLPNQQNPQPKPQFQRPTGQQQPQQQQQSQPQQQAPLPNQTQFRAPYPPQGQQRAAQPLQPQTVRSMQNPSMPQSPKTGGGIGGFDRPDFNPSNDINRMNALNSSFIISNDEDNDSILGKSAGSFKRPVDPMTQSQYGFLDNKAPSNGFSKPEEMNKKPGNTTSFMASDEGRLGNETLNLKSPLADRPVAKAEENMSQKYAADRFNYQIDNNAPRDNRPLASFMSPDSKSPMQFNSTTNENGAKGVSSLQRNTPVENKTSSDFVREAPKSVDYANSGRNVESSEMSSLNASRGRQTNRYSKGDNDSGVDETTQGNDRNGPNSPGSPLKSPTKNAASRPNSTTPSIKSNISRSASRSRNLKTPDQEPAKKVPMNKVQVGHAPSPNLKAVRSKIGSLDNASYKPGGGNVKIETKKIEIKATPRIEAKNDRYAPKGGDKKILSTKLQWNAKSKIGSLENAHHKPGGGDKKIETIKADFKDKAKPKVGSKDNAKYVAGGGDIKASDSKSENNIQTQKLEIKAQSKIGSLDNVKHKPGGGNKKIFDDKDYLKNVEHPIAPTTPPSQSPVPPAMTTSTGADENLNQQQQS